MRGTPHLLHYVWLDFSDPDADAPVEARFAGNLEGCRRLHEGWQVRVWGASAILQLLRAAYPGLLPLYSASKPVERTDIARLAIVHRFGGVYMDTDVLCVRPLGRLLEEAPAIARADVVLPQTTGGLISIGNYFIAARRPGSDFLGHALRLLEAGGPDASRMKHTLALAGPNFLHVALRYYRGRERVALLRAELAPCSVCGTCGFTEQTYLIHTFSSTWHGWGEAALKAARCRLPELASVAAIVLLAAALVALRRRRAHT